MHVQLEREGYEIASASTAEEATADSGEDPQNLVITDLHLPGVSGIELLKKVRVEYPETAVVVMTAFGTVQTAVEAMKAGAYDYLTKPIHPYEFKTLVKRSLEHHRLLEEVQVLADVPGREVRVRSDRRFFAPLCCELWTWRRGWRPRTLRF